MYTSSNITFLRIDCPHPVAVDIGIAVNPMPLRLKLIEFDVAAIITNVSNVFIFVVSFLFFSFVFGLVVFIFEVSNHFFIVSNRVSKTVYSIFFLISVLNQYFLVVRMGIKVLFFLVHFYSICYTNLPKYKPFPLR